MADVLTTTSIHCGKCSTPDLHKGNVFVNLQRSKRPCRLNDHVNSYKCEMSTGQGSSYIHGRALREGPFDCHGRDSHDWRPWNKYLREACEAKGIQAIETMSRIEERLVGLPEIHLFTALSRAHDLALVNIPALY